MTWIIRQILFHQNVEIENLPNFNNVEVSRYMVLQKGGSIEPLKPPGYMSDKLL